MAAVSQVVERGAGSVPPPDLRDSILRAVVHLEQPSRLTCAEALTHLHSYVDGELEGPQRERIEAHRVACPACDRAFTEMENYRGIFQSIQEVTPPADLRSAIYAEIDRLQPSFWDRLGTWFPSPASLRWATLPAALVLLGLVLLPWILFGPSGSSSRERPTTMVALDTSVSGVSAPLPARSSPVEPAPQPSVPTTTEGGGPRLSAVMNVSPPAAVSASSKLVARGKTASFSRRKGRSGAFPRRSPGPRSRSLPPSPGDVRKQAESQTIMQFHVSWPESTPTSTSSPNKLVQVVSLEPSEPSEMAEPLTLNYRRMFGAITNTGKASAPQPEDLGSSTGPSPAIPTPVEANTQGDTSPLPPEPGTRTESEPGTASLSAGESAFPDRAGTGEEQSPPEEPSLPYLGMGE